MASITNSPNKITFLHDNVGYKLQTVTEKLIVTTTINAIEQEEFIFPDANSKSLCDYMNDYAEQFVEKPSTPDFASFAIAEICSVDIATNFKNVAETETFNAALRYCIWGMQKVKDLKADVFTESKALAFRTYRPKKSLLSKTQQEIVSLLVLGNFANNVYLSADIEILNQDNSIANTISISQIVNIDAGADKYNINLSLSYDNLKTEILAVDALVNIDDFFGLNINFYLQEQVGAGPNPNTDPIIANSNLDTLYYKFDLKNRVRERQYLWLNQIGGREVLRAFGKRQDENEYEKEIATVYKDSFAYNEAKEETWHVEKNWMIEQNSGFFEIDSKNWQAYYDEFFASESVYEIQADNSLLPIILENKNYELANDNKELRSLSFKAKYVNNGNGYA